MTTTTLEEDDVETTVQGGSWKVYRTDGVEDQLGAAKRKTQGAISGRNAISCRGAISGRNAISCRKEVTANLKSSFTTDGEVNDRDGVACSKSKSAKVVNVLGLVDVEMFKTRS